MRAPTSLVALLTTGRGATSRTVAGLVVGGAVVVTVLRAVLAATAPYEAVVATFDDDAFYYFGIARNIAQGAGSTFGGLDATNGYHPLWAVLLVPIFFLFDGRSALVAVVVVSGGVFVATSVLLARLQLGRERTGSVLLAWCPLALSGLAGPAFFFSGMETGLVLLGWVVIATLVDRMVRRGATVPGALAVGVAMSCTVLARIDQALPVGVLVLVLCATRLRRATWTTALLMPLGLVVAGYVSVNLALFGTPVPVSGQAKALGGVDGLNGGTLLQAVTGPVVLGVPTMLGLAAVVVCVIAVRLDGRDLPPAAVCGVAVAVGGTVAYAYYALTSSWQLWPWYFAAAPLCIALTGPRALSRLRVHRVVAVGAVALLSLVVLATTVRQYASVPTRADYVARAVDVAERIDRLEPAGVPIAIGDRAGSLGFHTARSVVQLEGLTESSEYLDALRRGDVTDYLRRRDVGLYVRADGTAGRPISADCQEYGEPAQGSGPKAAIVVCDADLVLDVPLRDGTSYRVWRYPAG